MLCAGAGAVAYVGSLFLIGAVTLFALLMSWWLASWAGWDFWLGVPISIASGLVWALFVRLACEQLTLLSLGQSGKHGLGQGAAGDLAVDVVPGQQ